jgi:hypothetical protein
VQVPPSGELFLSWALPDNTGAFEIRAYAVSGPSDFGVATVTQHVRRPVSLVASAPRVARVGDSFSCGATVTAAPDVPKATPVTVRIALAPPAGADKAEATGALSHSRPSALSAGGEAPGGGAATSSPGADPPPLILDLTSRSLLIEPGATVEVTFPMRAVSLGTARVIITVTLDAVSPGGAGGGVSGPEGRRVLQNAIGSTRDPVAAANPFRPSFFLSVFVDSHCRV